MRSHRKILAVGGCLVATAAVSISLAAPAYAWKSQLIPPPTNVQLIPLHTAVSVSWTPPINTTGQQIDGYIVTATHRDATTVTCDADGTTSCPVYPLANGKNYRISVVAARALHGDGGIYGWIPIGKPSSKISVQPTAVQNCSYFGYFANLQGCDLSRTDLSWDCAVQRRHGGCQPDQCQSERHQSRSGRSSGCNIDRYQSVPSFLQSNGAYR